MGWELSSLSHSSDALVSCPPNITLVTSIPYHQVYTEICHAKVIIQCLGLWCGEKIFKSQLLKSDNIFNAISPSQTTFQRQLNSVDHFSIFINLGNLFICQIPKGSTKANEREGINITCIQFLYTPCYNPLFVPRQLSLLLLLSNFEFYHLKIIFFTLLPQLAD